MRDSTWTFPTRRSSERFPSQDRLNVNLRSIVEECRDKFLAAVPEGERSGLRWEHVGSTSIKGMPGTKFPDALLIIPDFPPSRGVIEAFLDCGYYFHASSTLDVRDLWWMLVFTEGRQTSSTASNINDIFKGS